MSLREGRREVVRVPLTAHALARELLAGPDLPVLTDGYEGGLTAVRLPRCGTFVRVDGRAYFGEYEDINDTEWVPSSDPFEAVVLSRKDEGI